MARAGRKPRAGKRVAGKRHSRARVPLVLVDRGTERTRAMQALYGQDGCDAIGRAYRSGLLGEGAEAKALLDMARAVSNAYWQAFATGSYTCALGDRTHGGVVVLDNERIRRREQWLKASLDDVRGMGWDVDRAFRQLVIDVNPDSGPAWLDQLCYARQRGKEVDPAHWRTLRAALDGLEMLAG